MLGNLIEKLQRRVDLTEAEAATAMSEIMGGQVASAQIAGMLVALRSKERESGRSLDLQEPCERRRCRCRVHLQMYLTPVERAEMV